MLTPQLQAALTRALLTAIPTAILAALAVYATTDDPKPIIVAGLTAFLTPFVTRGVGEGTFDSVRQATGDVRPADVGAKAPDGTIAARVRMAGRMPAMPYELPNDEPPPSARGG